MCVDYLFSRWVVLDKGGVIPGSKNDQSAYRSELGGQLGIAAVISSITLPSDVPTNSIMACDGLSALDQITASKTDFKVKGKHFDIISITCDLLTNTNLKVIPIHVYGHQDNLNRSLTFLEQFNCQMDTMAKHIPLEKN